MRQSSAMLVCQFLIHREYFRRATATTGFQHFSEEQKTKYETRGGILDHCRIPPYCPIPPPWQLWLAQRAATGSLFASKMPPLQNLTRQRNWTVSMIASQLRWPSHDPRRSIMVSLIEESIHGSIGWRGSEAPAHGFLYLSVFYAAILTSRVHAFGTWRLPCATSGGKKAVRLDRIPYAANSWLRKSHSNCSGFTSRLNMRKWLSPQSGSTRAWQPSSKPWQLQVHEIRHSSTARSTLKNHDCSLFQ